MHSSSKFRSYHTMYKFWSYSSKRVPQLQAEQGILRPSTLDFSNRYLFCIAHFECKYLQNFSCLIWVHICYYIIIVGYIYITVKCLRTCSVRIDVESFAKFCLCCALLSSSSVEYNTLSQIMSNKLGQSWFPTYVYLAAI